MDLHILLAADQAHAVHDMSGHMQCIILIQYSTRLGILPLKAQCRNEEGARHRSVRHVLQS